jgi:hypothetical protein
MLIYLSLSTRMHTYMVINLLVPAQDHPEFAHLSGKGTPRYTHTHTHLDKSLDKHKLA